MTERICDQETAPAPRFNANSTSATSKKVRLNALCSWSGAPAASAPRPPNDNAWNILKIRLQTRFDRDIDVWVL